MSQAGAVQSGRGVQLDVELLARAGRQSAGRSLYGVLLSLSAALSWHHQCEESPNPDNELPVQWLIGNLADRLRLVDFLKRHPAALDERVDVAGVIIGLPRGGSTLLQRLLCTSPQLNHTPWWELVAPLPLPGEEPGNPAPRIELGKEMAQGIYDAWPEMVAMHPVEALAPDEEILLIDRTLMCQMFSFYFNVPSYMPWLRTQDQSRGYAELETWLKVLQYQQPARRGRKWLLKSPHHLVGGGLRTMLDTFRGAKAIMTHRALENVVVSYCSMQELTVRNYTDNFDPKLIGEQAIDVFRRAIQNLIAVRRDYGEKRFIDVQYQDTVERPLEVYRSTMESMGLVVGEPDEQAARSWDGIARS